MIDSRNLSAKADQAQDGALAHVGWGSVGRCPLEFGYRLGRRRLAVLCVI